MKINVITKDWKVKETIERSLGHGLKKLTLGGFVGKILNASSTKALYKGKWYNVHDSYWIIENRNAPKAKWNGKEIHKKAIFPYGSEYVVNA